MAVGMRNDPSTTFGEFTKDSKGCLGQGVKLWSLESCGLSV